MAGGVGSRLGSITKYTPKPAIKINKKPYLAYILDWLRKSGFKKFYFLLSYKNKKIEKIILEYFANKKLSYNILIDKKRSGTFPAIYYHLKKIDKVFFYTNADELSDFNIKKMYLKFKKSKTNLMCGILRSKDGALTINKKKNIIESNTKKRSVLFKDCGYKFINKIIFKNSKNEYKKIEDFIYKKYLPVKNVSYFIIKSLPLRIDTAFDINRTKKKLKNV
tara:strand:+ start:2300 stop:2962 length:663 start_codon:yes stop_codon:yes gene_type:complete